MYLNKKVIVVLPSYNASSTLRQTFAEIPFDVVDDVVLVDDKSYDNTVEVAQELEIKNIILHDENRGYGGNQKTCYTTALDLQADIIVMLHPDYQYSPKLIKAMVSVIGEGLYEVMFGSRILGKGALNGGMPVYKYISNRVLTLVQNILMNQKLSEYHTGYRAYSAKVLQTIPYHKNSDDFVFDNQIVAQIFKAKFEIGELTCPTKYFEGASSISFSRSVIYGLGVLGVSVKYFLNRLKLYRWDILEF